MHPLIPFGLTLTLGLLPASMLVAETRTLSLDGFDSIRVDGVADVEVAVGSSFSIALEAPGEYIDDVEVTVEDDQLVIDMDDDAPPRDDVDIELFITMPELSSIEIRGVANITAHGVDEPRLVLRVSGVGEVKVQGHARKLDVSLSGVADVDLRDLVARSATVRLDGVGSAEVHSTESIDARVSGMGNVRIHGDPARVVERVSGMGSISRVR